MKKVAIIGSHGLYASYGGWDQLVNNLAELKSPDISYLIFNPKETPPQKTPPPGVKIKYLGLSASGIQGLLYDFISLFIAWWTCDSILLLGAQGTPVIPVLALFKKNEIITNVGGIEWERPGLSKPARVFLKFCFNLSFKVSNSVILDNQHFVSYAPESSRHKIRIIPYGGEIDTELQDIKPYLAQYPFLNMPYFLSISRSIPDNQIQELCELFVGGSNNLVLISNLSNSEYGRDILKNYSDYDNIYIIDGLYIKPELDMIRRNCTAYIHTHTLCGTAPSLVEMIICKKPIISVENPQNRNTLNGSGFFYSEHDEITELINSEQNLERFIPDDHIRDQYKWTTIVRRYEELY